MGLQLFLDNSDPTIWKRWLPRGIFQGITTNPTLLKESGQTCSIYHLKQLVKQARYLNCKEIHIQAWGSSSGEILKCAFDIGNLSTLETRVYVKIPITKQGITAAKELIISNIPITLTACYEAKQTILASAIGAHYLAPYLGRINDKGGNAESELMTMQKILKETNSNCKILVASIRDVKEIIALASKGIQAFTINSQIAEQLFECNETLNASITFEKDARFNNF